MDHIDETPKMTPEEGAWGLFRIGQGVAKKLGSYYLRKVTMPFPFENTPIHAWGQTREEWRSGPARKALMGTFLVS